MTQDQTSALPPQPAGEVEGLFTVDSANRALVLVRKIVADVVEHYKELMRLRTERAEQATLHEAEESLESMRVRIAEHIEKLGRLQAELDEIGCELKDWTTGLVDFPAWHEGRRVWLCWRLGEPAVEHWHELDAGFSGRRPIDDDFG